MMSKKLHFKTNTLLKDLVGKDLINDDNIAIVELVKNSYDANSRSVSVIFDGFFDEITDHERSKIVISDSGIGMNEVDIRDKWLNIAYSEKRNESQKTGSYLAGNKGVGRFSCDRLGSRLDMFTRQSNGELLYLKINWKDFEVDDQKDLTIQKIDVYLSRVDDNFVKDVSGIKMPTKGTILVISELRNKWRRDKILDLKVHLEKFINPNQLFQKSRFKVHLLASDIEHLDKNKEYHNRVNGEIENLIFENLKFNSTYIESTIDKTGKSIETKLYHDGKLVFRITELNSKYDTLKNIRIVLYYLNPYKKAYFKRQTGVRLVDFGSVFLFLNGFRVSPYGDRGNDWLGIDNRKAQGTSRYLGTRDVVGRAEILGGEEDFKPVSSREGLKNTDAFVNLKEKFILDVLRRLERFVVDGLDWDSIPNADREAVRKEEGLDWNSTPEKYIQSWDKKKRRISLSIMSLIGATRENVKRFWFNPELLEGVYEQRSQEVSKLISDVSGFDDDVVDGSLSQNLKKIAQIITEKNEAVKEAKTEAKILRDDKEKQRKKIKKLEKEADSYQQQSLFLQSVSTLSEKQLLGFHHQICLDSSIIENHILKLSRVLRSKGIPIDVIQNLEKISKANKRIMATAQYATKANFKSGTRKDVTDIPSYFEQYIDNVAKDFIASGVNIEVKNCVREAFEIKIKRIELSILIDNLISNADKAEAKNLVIDISNISDNDLKISFIDDGKGLDELVSRSVFDLGVTTTSGSGIGLYQVKKILESIEGEISIRNNTQKGVEVEMVITR